MTVNACDHYQGETRRSRPTEPSFTSPGKNSGSLLTEACSRTSVGHDLDDPDGFDPMYGDDESSPTSQVGEPGDDWLHNCVITSQPPFKSVSGSTYSLAHSGSLLTEAGEGSVSGAGCSAAWSVSR